MITVFLKGDPKTAEGMAAYMKNKFPFAGVKSPGRRQQEHTLLVDSKQLTLSALRRRFATLYALPEREYQYVAIDMMQHNVTRLTRDDLAWLSDYITVKPWWDSVDAIRGVIGRVVKRHPDWLAEVGSWYKEKPDFWQRRVGITLQLGFKTLTDEAYLREMMLADLTTDEFFIQKAIGWALRDYSKTNPDWVRQFIADHQSKMSSLAVREGSKYLN